jgi:hypothetical protein
MQQYCGSGHTGFEAEPFVLWAAIDTIVDHEEE